MSGYTMFLFYYIKYTICTTHSIKHTLLFGNCRVYSLYYNMRDTETQLAIETNQGLFFRLCALLLLICFSNLEMEKQKMMPAIIWIAL